jgi:hypothetical protein
MTFRVAHWDILEDQMLVLRFSMQREDTFECMNGKCHLCTLQSTCRPLWK